MGWVVGGVGRTTSLDTSMPVRTSPLRGHLVLKVERDGARRSNGQLFTRCLPTNIDKNLTDRKAGAWSCSDTEGRGKKRQDDKKGEVKKKPQRTWLIFKTTFPCKLVYLISGLIKKYEPGREDW